MTLTPRLAFPLAAAAFLVAADARLPAPLLPAIQESFDATTGRAGLIVSGYLIAYALCQLCYGPFGDRVGPLRLMRGSLTLFAVATVLCAFAPTLETLVALRVLTGISAAAVIPMSLAHLGDSIPLPSRTRVIGTLLSVLIAGQALGAGLGGVLAQFVSWRVVFVIIGICAAIAAMSLRRSAPRMAAGTRPRVPRGGLRTTAGLIGRNPGLFACLILEMFALNGAFPFVGTVLVSDEGLGYGVTGALLALFAVGAALGARLPMTDIRHRLFVGGALLAAGFALIAAQLGVPVSAVAILGLGFGVALAHATMQTRATEIDPERRASAVSVYAFTANAAGALGTLAVGATIDAYGAASSFAGAAVLLVVFALVAPRVLTHRSGDARTARSTKVTHV